MLYIVLHELMHDLGFTSNWQNWFLTGNKNQILITSKPDVVISDNEVIFDEFKETAFDRYLIFNSNYKNLSPVTVKLNNFANPAENMNNISTTFNFLSASYPKSCCTERAILKTTLIPFQNVPGKTLSDLVRQTGATSPIGPKLQAIMECMECLGQDIIDLSPVIYLISPFLYINMASFMKASELLISKNNTVILDELKEKLSHIENAQLFEIYKEPSKSSTFKETYSDFHNYCTTSFKIFKSLYLITK
ncbi:unnamed protein product [Rhizophagus irregularis]|nr:unnamed protein product [Rhizophagus irregularis]